MRANSFSWLSLALLAGCGRSYNLLGDCGTVPTELAASDVSPLGFSAEDLIGFIGVRNGELSWDRLDVGTLETWESREDDPETGGAPLTASFEMDPAQIRSIYFIETPPGSVGVGRCAASAERLDLENVSVDVSFAGLSLTDPSRGLVMASDLSDAAILLRFGADLSDPSAISETVAPIVPEGAVIESASLSAGGTLPVLDAGLVFTWLDPTSGEKQVGQLNGTWTQVP